MNHQVNKSNNKGKRNSFSNNKNKRNSFSNKSSSKQVLCLQILWLIIIEYYILLTITLKENWLPSVNR